MTDEGSLMPEFQRWMNQLNDEARSLGYAGERPCYDEDAWWPYFEEGLSPSEALEEDALNG